MPVAPLVGAFIEAVRAATNGGWALGDEGFKRRIAAALGRRVAPAPKGRPPKSREEARRENPL
jgi:putative transposase